MTSFRPLGTPSSRRVPQKAATLTRSGRMSAEPSSFLESGGPMSRIGPNPSTELDALDLGSLDLRNIDPVVAKRMLDEIRQGTDIATILERFRVLKTPSLPPREKSQLLRTSKSGRVEKVVTFEDDPDRPPKVPIQPSSVPQLGGSNLLMSATTPAASIEVGKTNNCLGGLMSGEPSRLSIKSDDVLM